MNSSLQVFSSAFVSGALAVIEFLFRFTHDYGWSLVVLAVAIKGVFWFFIHQQFGATYAMQNLEPEIIELRKRHKGKDRETKRQLEEATKALYAERGAHPLAGCLPALIPVPIYIAVYYAIQREATKFAASGWLWIGSPLAAHARGILAMNLLAPDILLLALYAIAMYFNLRFSIQATAPGHERRQKVTRFVVPVLVVFFGWRYHWPSGLLIYSIASNLLATAQQLYFLNPRTREHTLREAGDRANIRTIDHVASDPAAIGTEAR